MKSRKIKIINLNIPTKKIFPKNYCINSISKSNISTTNLSSLNPDKNIRTNDSYEDTITVKNKFLFNSPQNRSHILNYKNNAKNINNNLDEWRTEIKNNNYQNFTYDIKQNKSFVYIRKKGENFNLNNKFDNKIYSKNSIILNDYRKRIMKLFLSSFRNYYLVFIRKHFYSFIRNITFLIMKKELFYNANSKMKTKKIKLGNLKNINLSKSYDNCEILNQDKFGKNEYIERKNSVENIRLTPININKNGIQNSRYKSINRNFDNDKLENKNCYQYSPQYNNIFNTNGKVLEFKNVFISFDNKSNKYEENRNNLSGGKRNIFRCFNKKIKDIITKDKRISIQINYIFQIQKKQKKLKYIPPNKLKRINSLLDITQIYSLEFLPNKVKNIQNINGDYKEKVNSLLSIIDNILLLKQKKLLLYKLKVVIFVKFIYKLIIIIFFNKLGLSKKENTFSNEIFLLDDKLDINIDNFKNFDDSKDI